MGGSIDPRTRFQCRLGCRAGRDRDGLPGLRHRVASRRSSLLAEVPSVVVPEEPNILINPLHPAVSTVRARKAPRWTHDARQRDGSGPDMIHFLAFAKNVSYQDLTPYTIR